MRLGVRMVVLVAVAGTLLAGCGESAGTSSSTAASGAGASGASGSAASHGRPESSYAKAAAAAEASAPKHLSGGAVAIVDGTPITHAAYDHWLEVSAPSSVKSLISKSAKQQAVDALIRRAWTEAQAKELGVSVNASEVVLETQIDTKIRERLAKPGSLSQERLEQYFNEHKQIYSIPERRAIAFAITKSKSVAEAVAKERGGLTAAAGRHGIKAAPNRIGCARARDGAEGILAKICAAKTGVIGGPVALAGSLKTATAYYVFEVKTTIPATKRSFSQVKEQIKLMLSSQGEGQAMVKYDEESRTKLKEETECAAGYVTPLCKEYIAPKPTAAAKARPLSP